MVVSRRTTGVYMRVYDVIIRVYVVHISHTLVYIPTFIFVANY